MKTAVPTPDRMDPIRKMRPLSSFTLMVIALAVAGVGLAIILTMWKVY